MPIAESPGRESSEAKQLMHWIKGLVYSPRCHSLQDLGNGVVWCRLMGKLRPGTLASVLIINRPANVNDSKHNYMLLESAFSMANMPWYFDTRALIAGDSHELLKMAKCFAQMHVTPDRQLQRQKHPSKSSRTARYSAGEIELTQHLSSQHPSTEATAVELLDAVHPNSADAVLLSVASDEQQLKQQIQTMFHNQQVAVDAFMAAEKPRPFGYPLTAHNMCSCSKCLRQSQEAAPEL